MTVYDKIIDVLSSRNIEYKEIKHEVVSSCEHSMKMRRDAGLKWEWSKCIMMKASKTWRYFLVVTLHSQEINKKNLRPVMWEKDFRFCNEQELLDHMWVERGCVYPFGHDKSILTLVDEQIFDNDLFIFNPGDPERSIEIKTEDLKYIYSEDYPDVLYFDSEFFWNA